MDFENYESKIKSPVLEGIIVEPILLCCIKGISFYQMYNKLGSMLPISKTKIKRYLFYLINYDLIKYNGQKRIYIIKPEGYGLLKLINREKISMALSIKDIAITIE